MLNSALLVVFIKAPRPGWVKTRLAAVIGAQAACDAYRQLLDKVCNQIGALSNVQLRFSPDDAANEIRQWRQPAWTEAPQGGGDLGIRLASAFDDAFTAGAQRVAIIGSDCPYLTTGDIEDAWAALDVHDVVLGPAHDGGYWLVGLRQPRPDLFNQIPWGTRQVLESTLSRARAANLCVHLLRELSDIDSADDWRGFLNSLPATPC